MTFLEKDLEQIIFEAEKEELRKRGLWISGLMKRQLRIGNYGIADLVTFNRCYYECPDYEKGIDCINYKIYPKLIVTIYELKKEDISMSAFIQSLRYAKGIRRYLDKNHSFFYVEFEFVLIGKNPPIKSDFIYASGLINNLQMFTYSVDIYGLKFKEIGEYSLTDEGF